MKKKISVFALLLSLLLAVLVPAQLPVPVQAANSTETTADDVKYLDIESFVHGMGYSDFVANEGSMYLAFLNNSNFAVIEFVGIEGLDFTAYYTPSYKSNVNMVVTGVQSLDGKVFEYTYLSPAEASKNNNFTVRYNAYSYDAENAFYLGNHSYSFELYSWSKKYYDFQYLVYSDFDVYLHEGSSKYFYREGDLVFECTKEGVFSFPVWCADAGLNCLASSNESPTKIPYSYNSYWHIVRRTSSGNWLLTTIGSTLGQSKMNLRLSDSGDLIIYEFSGDDSFTISVRQYVYDTDGWKVRTYDTYDYDDFSSGLLTLPAGSGLDDTRVLAYTSTDIYSSDGLSVYAAASTEYVEPSAPDVTPEPTPGSGSSGSGDSDDTGSGDSGSSGGGRPGTGTRPSVGGEASGGGGLDFIINLFTLIWTKICSVPMAVDGYSISLQQIFVYGALVSIVGGFIIKFIFRR